MSLPPQGSEPTAPDGILIVDDEAGTRETLVELLEGLGFRTATASTGRDALALLRSRRHSVALLDIGLPDIEGTDLLAEARLLQPDTKCIMVSGNVDLQRAVDSLNQGAYAYIRKPFHLEDVRATVYRALRQQSLELENRAISELARSLVEHVELEDRLRLIARYLTGITRTSACAVWLVLRDALVPTFATGIPAEEDRKLSREDLPLDRLPAALRGVLDAGRALAAEDADGLLPPGVLECLPARPLLLLPLRWRGKSIGLVALCPPLDIPAFSPDEIRQAETISYLAAVAIQQAKIIQQERDTLRTLAESFLSHPPRIEGIEIHSLYVSASEVARMGGDYYDFITDLPGTNEDQVGIVIGDVCGKGEAAISYAFKSKHMLSAFALEDPTPERAITRLNRALRTQMTEECTFTTIIYGVLDARTGRFVYTNAGHPPPVLCNGPGSDCRELMPTGGMVGALDEMRFSQQEVVLPSGSVLALFTDGVSEARTGGRMLEISGVTDVVREHAAESARSIARAILRQAQDFNGGVLRDDVAIVVIKKD